MSTVSPGQHTPLKVTEVPRQLEVAQLDTLVEQMDQAVPVSFFRTHL
jgi:hypothetical protein